MRSQAAKDSHSLPKENEVHAMSCSHAKEFAKSGGDLFLVIGASALLTVGSRLPDVFGASPSAATSLAGATVCLVVTAGCGVAAFALHKASGEQTWLVRSVDKVSTRYAKIKQKHEGPIKQAWHLGGKEICQAIGLGFVAIATIAYTQSDFFVNNLNSGCAGQIVKVMGQSVAPALAIAESCFYAVCGIKRAHNGPAPRM